ncbi:Hypothetical predicted protein, partial [Paramuricea clavata]
ADASEIELMVLKILVSSANIAILELNGPRMDPCGTPDVTGSGLDVAPRTVVC